MFLSLLILRPRRLSFCRQTNNFRFFYRSSSTILSTSLKTLRSTNGSARSNNKCVSHSPPYWLNLWKNFKRLVVMKSILSPTWTGWTDIKLNWLFCLHKSHGQNSARTPYSSVPTGIWTACRRCWRLLKAHWMCLLILFYKNSLLSVERNWNIWWVYLQELSSL